MKKYTFDAKNGLWYEQCGEYQLPCLTVPNSKMIGRWGQHHRRYLRQHKYGYLYRPAADRQAGRLSGGY